jgi:endonuclease-8
MPEGPEIRQAADRIAQALVGQPLVNVEITVPSLKTFEQALEGASVARIDTRGKAMLTRFDNGLVMYSHNQLYGRWYVSKLPSLPRTTRSLRVAFDTPTHTARLYSATDIDILDESELYLHPFLRSVGPDVLDPALTAREIADRLRSDRFRRRSFGSLYLDQKFLAGIGNYLRSEILFVAGQSPERRPCDLDRAAIMKLARATLRICERAYRNKGVTVTRTLATRLQKQGQPYRDYRHFVFTRDGRPCYECGSEIRRLSVAGRKFFLCPGCQR